MQTLGDFTINANTGVITVATAPTFVGRQPMTMMRTLTIRATDTDTDTDPDTDSATGTIIAPDATLTITITEPATFTITADPPSPSVNERDTATGGGEVTLATLSAAYPGGTAVAGVAYEIAPTTPAHPFMIDGNLLILPADATVDHEAVASYTLMISGTAGGCNIDSDGYRYYGCHQQHRRRSASNSLPKLL